MRDKTLERHPELPTSWRGMLLELGVDGMSSDDTDGEDFPRRLRRIPKVWRSTHLDMLLETIDRTYTTPSLLGGMTKKGNPRRNRTGDHPSMVSTDIPVIDYPSNFYNLEWLKKNQPAALPILSRTWGKPIELPVRK